MKEFGLPIVIVLLIISSIFIYLLISQSIQIPDGARDDEGCVLESKLVQASPVKCGISDDTSSFGNYIVIGKVEKVYQSESNVYMDVWTGGPRFKVYLGRLDESDFGYNVYHKDVSSAPSSSATSNIDLTMELVEELKKYEGDTVRVSLPDPDLQAENITKIDETIDSGEFAERRNILIRELYFWRECNEYYQNEFDNLKIVDMKKQDSSHIFFDQTDCTPYVPFFELFLD
jgi:hypothetical protein